MMSLCILTNSSALFPPAFSNNARCLRIMPLDADEFGITLPELDDFDRIYCELEREFNAILVLTASEMIVPIADTAHLAAQRHGGLAKISVLDTRQIGPGLGILAQLAGQKAAAGASMPEVEEIIRAVIPYLFTIICPGNPAHYQDGKRQSAPGHAKDQTSAVPVYSLEEGLLVPYKKVRTQRHLLESLQEFLEEFEKPQHLTYFHSKNTSLHVRSLRDVAGVSFPSVNFNDLDLNATTLKLFGEHTVGLTVLEMPGDLAI